MQSVRELDHVLDINRNPHSLIRNASNIRKWRTAFVEVEVSRAPELRILVQLIILLAPLMAISIRFLLLLSFLCCLSQTICAVMETESDSYQNRSHSVATVRVEKRGTLGCSLWVAIPKDAGRYPVVQFQHGFQLQNTDYTGLITQVASWGFIVVAPQMYELIPTDVTTEITNARSVLNWMKTGLIASLPKTFANHRPDFDKVALAGHSRGGLVVFGLALNYGNALQPYSAIMGLDPVDAQWPVSPSILTHKENSMDVGVPTLIVGTGLGSQQKGALLPACAPKDLGHINFYTDLKPASFHFVATNNGHMDFTDDCKGLDKLSAVRCLPICKDGPSRQPMRQFSAGIMVAFLQDVLFQNNASLSAALTQEVPAPVPLDPPQCKGDIFCTSDAHQYADI